MFGGGGDSVMRIFKKEEWSCDIYNFKDLLALIILVEKLLNQFGSWLHDGQKRSTFPFIHSFTITVVDGVFSKVNICCEHP